MSSLTSIFGDFKTIEEWKKFAEAQHKTIIQLNSKLKNLEEEKESLKKLLEKSTPLIQPQREYALDTDDEEYIARTQLARLKQIADERELTLEESKRTEIFVKILNGVRNTPKTIEVKTKELSNDQLLAIVSSNDNNGK